MSELVMKLLFLTPKEQRLVAALDIQKILTHEILLELGYDANDSQSISALNSTISDLNKKMPDELKLVKIRNSSKKRGRNPVIIFARDLNP